MRGTMGAKPVKDFILMNKLILFLCLLPAVFISSCKDETGDVNSDFFPDVQVNTNINLLLPQYSALSLVQGYVYLPDGYRGVVVYRTIADEFVAFDRTCPYNTSEACAFVSTDSSGFYFRCGQYAPSFKPCCDSRFDANTGTAVSGPAKRGLKTYFTRRDGNIIYISSIPF